MLNKIFNVFILIFLYKLSINIGRLIRINILSKYYNSLLTPNTNNKVYETKKEVITLFKKAGVKDNKVPVIENLGYHQLAQYEANLFDNYPSNKIFLVSHYLGMFDEARGTFKYRIYECFNPFYWLNCILFAPKHLLEYLGMNIETLTGKILNLILTAIYWIIPTIFSFYSPKLKNLFIHLINELFK